MPTGTSSTPADLAALGEQPFVSLTTFRRSGQPVATPVWVGWDGDALVVTTPRASGKVKRLRNDPRVELRPCSRTGHVDPGFLAVPGQATILDDDDSHDRLTKILRRKYGLEYLAVMMLERLGRPGGTDRVVLRIGAAHSPC